MYTYENSEWATILIFFENMGYKISKKIFYFQKQAYKISLPVVHKNGWKKS